MPFVSKDQRAWMFANEPEMAKRWAKHTPKGKRLPKRVRKESVGLEAGVANLFAPMMTESDYTWTKRASLASAGVLLGLLAAKTAGGKGDYVPPQTANPPAQQAPQKPNPAPPAPTPSQETPGTKIQPQEVFQSQEALSVDEAKEFINPSEGTRSKVYHDSRGKKTVGVGFNLNQPGAAKLMRDMGINYTAVKTGQKRLSPEEIEVLFTRKVQDAMAAGRRIVNNFDEQPKDVQLAVTDLIYNMGPTGFSNFDETVTALEKGDYGKAASNLQRSSWYRQVGGRAEKVLGLIRGAGAVAVRESMDSVFRFR